MTLKQVLPRGVVRVTGSDAATYLQGQVSQDVDALAEGQSAWSLVLDPAGKLVAWFRVLRQNPRAPYFGGDFLLDCEIDVVDALVARLDRFKLRTDVQFAPLDGFRMTRFLAPDGVALPAAGYQVISGLAWPGFGCTDQIVEGEPLVETDDGFEEARIRAACPRMGVDIDEDTIPAEGGQPLIDLSVSFTKGCYTGQELVARIDSRGGNVPRPLRVLEAADGSTLAVGASVVFDGQEIGTATSAVGSVALGRILRKAEIGAAVEVGGVAATVVAPTGSA